MEPSAMEPPANEPWGVPADGSWGGPAEGIWEPAPEEAYHVPRFTEDMLTEPLPTSREYITRHCLEDWVGEALDMMSYEQRIEVMGPPLNLERTTNANGVVLSRIKEVCSVDHRLQMFIAINGLAEGVVDRLGTLTPEQQERVMESSMKIQKAKNPSGVAMRRISDVLKYGRVGTAPPAEAGAYVMGLPAPAPAPSQSPPLPPPPPARSSAAPVLGLEQALAMPSSAPSEDRSRSRPPLGPGGPSSDALAPDVVELIRDFTDRGLQLEWWVGEVLTRLSLWQRQNIARDVANTHGVRNPSSFIMSRVRALADPRELVSIFIDLNGLDRSVADQLWTLTAEQQSAVIAPGIYVQNVRNPSTAVRSRITQVLAGNDAVGPSRRSDAPAPVRRAA